MTTSSTRPSMTPAVTIANVVSPIAIATGAIATSMHERARAPWRARIQSVARSQASRAASLACSHVRRDSPLAIAQSWLSLRSACSNVPSGSDSRVR